jgi:hypothetical protein
MEVTSKWIVHAADIHQSSIVVRKADEGLKERKEIRT